MKEKYYQIGEFSKLCHLPIRTLHYYNEIGLLIPSKIDEESNYRYYSQHQVLEASVIQFYKEAGFALKDIKVLLQRERLEFNQQMIATRCEEIESQIAALTVLKNQLSYFTYNKGEEEKQIEVIFKQIPLSNMAYERYTGPCDPEAFMVRYSRLHDLVKRKGLHMCGPLMSIYYDDYRNYNYEKADIEVCVPVIDETPHETTRLYGGFFAAVATHYGSYKTMPLTYQKMLEAIEEKGYVYPGKGAIESYIIDCVATKFEELYVTEIILPIQSK